MENKIRQLTDKLYEEGLQKGKSDSERLIAEAKQQAQQIIVQAQKRSEEIISEAQKRDQQMAQAAIKDVKMSAARVICDTKESVKSLLSAAAFSTETAKEFTNTEFVGKLISTIVDNWSRQSPNAAISVMVPDAIRSELEQFLFAKTFENLNANLEIKSDSRVLGGFRIASSQNGFYVSFTDEQFNNFFKEYLRDKVSEIVFGK